MSNKPWLLGGLVVTILLFFWTATSVKVADPSMSKTEGAVYIVHVKKNDAHANDLENYHLDILSSVCGSKEAAKEVMLYSYNQAMNGFSAKLTDDQVKALSETPGVVQVVPSRVHTTHESKGVGGAGPRVTTVGGTRMSTLGGAVN